MRFRTPHELGAICGRAATKLYQHASDVDAMADVATALQFVAYYLRRDADAYRRLWGATDKTLELETQLMGMERSLAALREDGGTDCASGVFENVHSALDSAVHILALRWNEPSRAYSA